MGSDSAAIALLLTIGLSPFPLCAAGGTLTGYLKAPDGRPLKNARVTVSGPALYGRHVTISDARGFYCLSNLPPGRDYHILYEADRLQTGARYAIQVHAGTTWRLSDIQMCTVLELHCPSFMWNPSTPMIDMGWSGTTQVFDGAFLRVMH